MPTEALPPPHPDTRDEVQPLLPKPSPQPPSPTTSSALYGYVLMAISSIGFSLMSLFVHVAEVRYNFYPPSSAFIRGAVQAILAMLYGTFFMNVRQSFEITTRKQRLLITFRGLLGSVGLLLNFISLAYLPVGICVTIFFLSPVWVMILSRLFLEEPITATDISAAICSFTGLLFLTRPDKVISDLSLQNRHHVIGVICVLLGSLLGAMAYVTQRAVGRSGHFMFSVFSMGFFSTIVTIPLGGVITPNIVKNETSGLLFVLLGAVSAFMGQSFLNKGLQYCRAGPGTLIRNIDVPLVYFLGLVFLNETISVSAIIGSCLIMCGTLLIGLRQFFNRKSLS